MANYVGFKIVNKYKFKNKKLNLLTISNNLHLINKFTKIKFNDINKSLFSDKNYINIYLVFRNNFNNAINIHFKKIIFFKMNGTINSLLGKKKCFKKKIYLTKFMYFGLLNFLKKIKLYTILTFKNINMGFQEFYIRYLPKNIKIFLKNKIHFLKKRKTRLKRYVKKKINKL